MRLFAISKVNAVLIIVILVLAVFAAVGWTWTATPQEEVKFGALLPLTGAWSSSGECSEAALEIAVEDINQHLSNSKITVSLVVEDTETDPEVALEKLKSLAGNGVRVVIGPQTSAEVAAVKPYAEENGILLLSQSSTAPSLAIPEDNLFRFCPDDTHQAEAVARLMWDEGVRVVIPLWRGDVWGDDLSEATKSSFEKLGGKVVDGVRYSPTTEDFGAELESLNSKVSQAIAQHGIDAVAVYFIAFGEVVPIFIQAAQSNSILSTVKWYGSDGTAQLKGLVNNAQAAQFAIRVVFPCPLYGEEAENEKDELIRERIQEKIGRAPDSYAVAAYDALWIATLAYLTSGTDDSEALKKTLVQTAESFFGATGWAAFNEAGDRTYYDYDILAVKADNGAFKWERVARYQVDPSLPERVIYTSPDFIVVGAALPLTGEFAHEGSFYKAAYELATKEVNDAGGIFVEKFNRKIPIKLIIYDDESDKEKTAKLVEQLVTKDNVDVLLGGYSSTLVKEQVAVPEKEKIPYVNGGGGAVEIYLTEDGKRRSEWVFGLWPPINQASSATMDLLKAQVDSGKLPKPLKIAVVWQNTDHGIDYRNGVLEKMKVFSGYFELVVDKSFEFDASDFTSLLRDVAAKQADVFLADTHLPHYLSMHQQYIDLGLYGQHKVVSYGIRGSEKPARDQFQEKADYLISALPWNGRLPYPQVKLWVENWEKATGLPAETYGALGYETARTLYSTIEQAGSLDKTKVRDALQEVSLVGAIVPGQRISFSENGQALTPYVIIQNLPDDREAIIWLPNAAEAPLKIIDADATSEVDEIVSPVNNSPYVWTAIGTFSENFNWICLENGYTWMKTYPEDRYKEWREAFLQPAFVRDYTILYLREIEDKILPDPLAATWTGGRETPEGLVGSETFVYRAEELEVTIQYPVVLPENTIYKITVKSQGSTVWEGQLFQRQFTSSST